MSLPVVIITKEMKDNKRSKSKINVGNLVKSKFKDMEVNTREVIIRRMFKEVVVCVHAVTGEKKFIVKFEYGK